MCGDVGCWIPSPTHQEASSPASLPNLSTPPRYRQAKATSDRSPDRTWTDPELPVHRGHSAERRDWTHRAESRVTHPHKPPPVPGVTTPHGDPAWNPSRRSGVGCTKATKACQQYPTTTTARPPPTTPAPVGLEVDPPHHPRNRAPTCSGRSQREQWERRVVG